ncbi:MAG: hypothetical protein QM401_00465 [Bacillota bacterium]|nr:hypothetical protein [Bacillota bacterium]
MYRMLGLELSRIQRVLDMNSPMINAFQVSNQIVQRSWIGTNDQLVQSMQSIIKSIERRIPIEELIGLSSFSTTEHLTSGLTQRLGVLDNLITRDAIKTISDPFLLSGGLERSIGAINLEWAEAIAKTIANLSINTRDLEESILQRLDLVNSFNLSDWTYGEDTDDFDLEGALNRAAVELNSNISFQQKIKNVIITFKDAQPVLALLIVVFLLSPLQSYIDDAVLNFVRSKTTTIMSQAENTSYKVIEKTIRIEVSNSVNMNIASSEMRQYILTNYRYVSSDKLAVRHSNRVKSNRLYTLEFGDVVRIVYKNKNWTLIEFICDDDTVIQGWVFTRYLSKFKR